MYTDVLTNTVAITAAGDASATRTVYAVVGALGVIGVALIVLGIWLIKQTRPERELLAPLERMQDRSWRQQAPSQMRRDLDEVRPPGARPVVREPDPPNLDEQFAQSRPALATFDDLQAQLAADARRSPSSGADPLLRPPAGAVAVPHEAPAPDAAAEAAPQPAALPDTTDATDATDATDGIARPPSDGDTPELRVADGTVTHTPTSGSAEIAALLANPPESDDDSPA